MQTNVIWITPWLTVRVGQLLSWVVVLESPFTAKVPRRVVSSLIILVWMSTPLNCGISFSACTLTAKKKIIIHDSWYCGFQFTRNIIIQFFFFAHYQMFQVSCKAQYAVHNINVHHNNHWILPVLEAASLTSPGINVYVTNFVQCSHHRYILVRGEGFEADCTDIWGYLR